MKMTLGNQEWLDKQLDANKSTISKFREKKHTLYPYK